MITTRYVMFPLLLATLCVGSSWADDPQNPEQAPEPAAERTEESAQTAPDHPNPLADPNAVQGGAISIYAGQYPQSFNYYLDNNVLSSELFSSLYETLLDLDPLTTEYIPNLAERWSISDDLQTFTFHLDPAAAWSDGQPVTAHDVAWTFNAVLDPLNLTGPHKVSLENFDPPEVLDERTIRFHAKNVHWRNLGAVGSFHILPMHTYSNRDFNKINFEFPVVSGPYQIGEEKSGIFVTLQQRPDWWARSKIFTRNTLNFDTIKYRFYDDQFNAFEAFKKGDLDVYPVYTARIWINETSGERFEKNWIVKQLIKNRKPIGFQGFAMNMRRPPFDDLRVRQAMAHLLDREKMNATLMYNQYFLHKSYFEDLYSPEHPCLNPVFNFDKARARELLAEAGWKANPETGILEKDGKPFHFKFLTRDPSTDKFLAIYSEDLKDVGIDMGISRKDWAAWTKDMGEFNYEMTWAAWSAGIFKDPEGMWETKEADRSNGNNVTGFKNPEVDALIEEQKTIFDVARRNDIARRIDHLIAEQVPYVLLWNLDVTRLLYWNKFGTPPNVLSKFGSESSVLTYWWLDEDSAADLADAMQTGAPLPPKPALVEFKEKGL